MEVVKTIEFTKWMAKLKDKFAIAKINTCIYHLEFGLLGKWRSVGKYVSEIKIDYGAGYRIYFTKQGDEIIILLIGGTKQRQSDDIEKAQKLAKKYREDTK